MKRTIEQWQKSDPRAMAYEQSQAATFFALEDARADILELYRENLRLRNIARIVAFPQQGTPEESYGLRDLSKILQSTYSAEQLWVEPGDR